MLPPPCSARSLRELRASCLPQTPCSQPQRLLRAAWGRRRHPSCWSSCWLCSRYSSDSRARSPPASASGQISREAHAARRARRRELQFRAEVLLAGRFIVDSSLRRPGWSLR